VIGTIGVGWKVFKQSKMGSEHRITFQPNSWKVKSHSRGYLDVEWKVFKQFEMGSEQRITFRPNSWKVKLHSRGYLGIGMEGI
jgi:hypothetical protein